MGNVLSGAISAVEDFLSQVHVSPQVPTFSGSAPKGFVPYPGSKLEAYNRFWNNDVCPPGQCKAYNRAHGVSYWANQIGGDTIIKRDPKGPTMMIILPSTYNDDVKHATKIGDINYTANKCQVFIKQAQ
jgi:hypothetical protein